LTSAIEFFLTKRLQEAKHHQRGWEWYVLDREGLNQDILQILLTCSPAFGRTLLDVSGKCDSCIRQPPNCGDFDLAFYSDLGEAVYVEIKIDQEWGSRQQTKEIGFLQQKKGARGVLLLLSRQAAKYTKATVASIGGGLMPKISYTELYRALDAVGATNGNSALGELAAAYQLGLREQEVRTCKFGDPNL
jgi:hypothetical protein